MKIVSPNSSSVLQNNDVDVSVIIPTYNRIGMLKQALESVFSQEEFDGSIEIIVIDDNSQDGTSEIINSKYPDVRLITLPKNRGSYITRNQAISEAKGKYIAFLDSDDLWDVNYLKTQTRSLEGREKCFCVSGLVIWHTDKNTKQIRIQKPDLKRFVSPIHHLLVSNFIVTPSSIVVPRQAFDEVGLFDENLRLGGDADFYIRCLLAGYEIIFTELPVSIKREHGKDQLTNTNNLNCKEKYRLMRIKKFFSLSIKDTSGIIPSRQKVYEETYANLAKQYFKNNKFWWWFVSYSKAIFYRYIQ